MNLARGDAISEGHRRNRSWAREHPGQRDEAWFKREIVPKLDAFSLKEIGKATGLSLAACSRIRAGAKVPHPSHWERCSHWSKRSRSPRMGLSGAAPNNLGRRGVLGSWEQDK